MELKIRSLFKRYFDKLPSLNTNDYMWHTSGVNSKFNGYYVYSGVGNRDVLERIYPLAKLAGLDMSYLDNAYTTMVVFNKILSGPAAENWINSMCNTYTFDEDKHKFFVVFVPMYMKEKFSINAIKAMQRSLIDRLGLTDADRIDINMEAYLKPEESELWNIYYNKEKNTTVVVTDGNFTGDSYRNKTFAKVLYNEYLFNGSVIPEDIIDYIDDALVRPSAEAYSNRAFDDNTLFTMEDLTQYGRNDAIKKTLIAQDKILDYIYKVHPDIVDTMRKEEIKLGLQSFVMQKTNALKSKVDDYMNSYQDYQSRAASAYQNYLNANEDLMNYNNKKTTFVDDLLNKIDVICADTKGHRSVIFEGINYDRYNNNKAELEFSVCGPVQGIDMDDLEILERNWKQQTPQFWEQVLSLIKGDTSYRLYLGQRVSLGLEDMKPSFKKNHYDMLVLDAQPNPHLYNFNCWGNTPETLRQLNNNGDLATVLAVFIKAALSLNVRDTAVMSRLIDNMDVGEMFYNNYNSVINMDTGELMTFEHYLDVTNSLPVNTDDDDDYDDDYDDDDDEDL